MLAAIYDPIRIDKSGMVSKIVIMSEWLEGNYYGFTSS